MAGPADDEYVDQAAIFAHSDKGFTTNKLATQWLEGYLDARRAASVLGHGVLQMASSLDRHQTDSSIDFVRYAERDHLLVISRTYRSHFMPVYLRPFRERTVRLCRTAHAKPAPASPRSSS